MRGRQDPNEQSKKGYYTSVVSFTLEEGLYRIGLVSVNEIAPIGQRLAKKDPLPDYPVFCTNEQQAEELKVLWQKYIDSQNIRKYKKRRR